MSLKVAGGWETGQRNSLVLLRAEINLLLYKTQTKASMELNTIK